MCQSLKYFYFASSCIYCRYLMADGPIMSSQPKSLRVREGTSARFSCLAEGNPQPRYSWVRISGGKEERVADTAELVLVGSGHTVGEYQVRASDWSSLIILASYWSVPGQCGGDGGQESGSQPRPLHQTSHPRNKGEIILRNVYRVESSIQMDP